MFSQKDQILNFNEKMIVSLFLKEFMEKPHYS